MSIYGKEEHTEHSQDRSHEEHEALEILLKQLEVEFGLVYVEEKGVLGRHGHYPVAYFLQIVHPTHE